MLGGLYGLLMAILGVAILLAGASQQSPITLNLVVRVIGYAILLGFAMYLPLGDTNLILVLISVLLAGIVATCSIWARPSKSAR